MIRESLRFIFIYKKAAGNSRSQKAFYISMQKERRLTVLCRDSAAACIRHIRISIKPLYMRLCTLWRNRFIYTKTTQTEAKTNPHALISNSVSRRTCLQIGQNAANLICGICAMQPERSYSSRFSIAEIIRRYTQRLYRSCLLY